MGKRRGGGRLPKRDEVVGTAVLPVIRFPHSAYLTANEKDFSLSLEMTMREGGILPPSSTRSQPKRRRLASLFFPSANPLPFGHPPSTGRG